MNRLHPLSFGVLALVCFAMPALAADKIKTVVGGGPNGINAHGVNLPGLNGYEVLEHLRADPWTRSIPVIALSANAMANDVERGLKAGFFRYVTKPINVNDFMEALREALASLPA